MQDQGTDRLLTTGEVARAFFVDPKTVTKWADAGKLAHVRTPGNHRRFRESDVFALLRGSAPADLNTLMRRASEVVDRLEFDFRSAMSDEPGVTVIAFKGALCQYVTDEDPAAAMAAAVDKLAEFVKSQS